MLDQEALLHFLPQKEPVAFIKEVLLSEEHASRTKVTFEGDPTLSMLSEAGAQTSIFLKLTQEKAAADIPLHAMGMLVSIKSKWMYKSKKRVFEVESHYINNLDSFFVVGFTVYDGDIVIAQGQIAAVLETNGASL